MDESDSRSAMILRFPAVRREPPSIEAVTALAPSHSLVDSLLAEVGFEARDTASGFGREFRYLLRAIEIGSGPDDAVIRLRQMLDNHLVHAMELCRAFQATGDRLVGLEVQMGRAAKLGGAGQSALRKARREFRDMAIAARVAADAALGASQALADHVGRLAGEMGIADGVSAQLQLVAAAG